MSIPTRTCGSRWLVMTVLLVIGGAGLETLVPAAAGDTATSPPGWSIAFDGSDSSPELVDGLVYLGSADGAVYALNADYGVTRWRFQTGSGLESGNPGVVVIPAGDGGMKEQIKAGLDMANKPPPAIKRVDRTPVVDNNGPLVAIRQGCVDGSRRVEPDGLRRDPERIHDEPRRQAPGALTGRRT